MVCHVGPVSVTCRGWRAKGVSLDPSLEPFRQHDLLSMDALIHFFVLLSHGTKWNLSKPELLMHFPSFLQIQTLKSSERGTLFFIFIFYRDYSFCSFNVDNIICFTTNRETASSAECLKCHILYSESHRNVPVIRLDF